jgi:tellurite methyltransferase
MESVALKWDSAYADSEPVNAQPCAVLVENSYFLPSQGFALDLACGLGANACFLAAHGLVTEAWDCSGVALTKLKQYAVTKKFNVSVRQCFISEECFVPSHFHVIVVSRFLDRSLCDAIIASLVPGGLLFYQTFTLTKVNDKGPSNRDFLLEHTELLKLFTPLDVLYYRDNQRIGDTSQGLRNEAQFIGRKLL